MAVWNPVKRSAMHYKHLALRASMAERDGWQQPAQYSSVEAELQYLRETLGISDISHNRKLVLKGDGLEQQLSNNTSGASGMGVGDVRLDIHTYESVPSSITVAKLASDEILLLIPPNLESSLAESLVGDSGSCPHVVDLTSGLAGVIIVGPKARGLLANVSELDTSDEAFPDLRCAQMKIADVHGTILRTDQAGVPGYQLYFGREFGEYIWDALLEAAQEHGGAPVGFEAIALL